MKLKFCVFSALLLTFPLLSQNCYGQSAKAPIMGWSSWNSFRIHIDEKLIKEQADALVSSGLYEAGYRYINVDDGYFGGRDKDGKLFVDSTKFPNGMGAVADYIHSKGLKAGLYSEGGKNTCGSIWDNDTKGIGVGMYGHEKQDAELFFSEWNFDFIKVDWCGGKEMNLNQEEQYTKIVRAVKAVKPDAGFNLCRWQFPGEWAIRMVDSWRISEDIRNNFGSVLHIIDLNRDLYKYASPGHYNDMDMLQVGRGMSFEEDKTHFSMWCMLNSPLMAGNDLRTISRQTIEILTNKELIALHQDKRFYQARSILREGNMEIWEKLLSDKKKKAIAIMNRGDSAVGYTLVARSLGLNAGSNIRDLWLHRSLGKIGKERKFTIPAHGIIVLEVSI
ncbi:glycoside hydrolase family 27 protein [Sphingobacterium spiritivorum]|uniref:glycoside hydrolase family 27 protein n=1 Tax=Sphingobacterium spiritivorum TaxID=258 RepID=UPI001917ECBB|nr:glycoside hydrolase family 27 protein [Sphingobacterium spiritivorum]QQT25871.1 glycoside hydrolase family 27 protein [Sphingobacterium spiritivorum]